MGSLTMVQRIFVVSGIQQALAGLTDVELRAVLDTCERGLAIRGWIPKDYRNELEEWRRILLRALLYRQLQGVIQQRIREALEHALNQFGSATMERHHRTPKTPSPTGCWVGSLAHD